jgi:tellurite resistance protein
MRSALGPYPWCHLRRLFDKVPALNKEPAVSEVTLEERGRALENQFFEKENQKKLEAMRAKDQAQTTREDLRKASGMTDEAVLDKLIALGLRTNTIAALSLVPLIEVAWADGEIQDNERNAILQGAHGKGLEAGSDGYELLQSWLRRKPDPGLYEAWEAYIKALAGQLNDEQNKLLRNQIVGFAKMVAASAGGFLGIGKVSASEEKVLHRIESAFNR